MDPNTIEEVSIRLLHNESNGNYTKLVMKYTEFLKQQQVVINELVQIQGNMSQLILECNQAMSDDKYCDHWDKISEMIDSLDFLTKKMDLSISQLLK